MKPHLETISKNGGPIFKQLAKMIRRRLIRGELQPGDKLPSAKEKAMAHQVNPNTVVACYKALEQSGITETRRGLGTFIRHDVPVDLLRKAAMRHIIETFLRDIADIGVSVGDVLAEIRKKSS